jgi:pyridoxal phosphate enzyme (YggS family)
MSYPELPSRLAAVRERIARARERSGRADGVTLVAVTKTHGPEAVLAARRAGLEDAGENRVAELESKVAEVGRDSIRWHLIGHLQRNKVKRALPLFDLLHSLDSPRLAQTLSDAAVAAGSTIRALAQVNVSGEETKGGFEAAGLLAALEPICRLPGLRVEGLMTMAPLTEEEAVLRRTFSATRALWERAGREVEGFHALHLSMGMSNDYEIAVEEGSTMVRLGTVLFGARAR